MLFGTSRSTKSEISMSCFINQFSPLRTTTLCNVYVLSNESSTSKRVSLSKNNLGFLINEDVLSVTEYFQELINYPATVEKGKKQKKKKKMAVHIDSHC